MNLQFRIWDKNRKKVSMISTLTWNYDEQNLTAFTVDSDTPLTVMESDLMQYTGERDTLGYRLFANDIVQIKYSPEIFYHSCTTKGIIIYNDGFYIRTVNDNYVYLEQCESIELLGNIYENPELLEIKKPTYGDMIRELTNEALVTWIYDTLPAITSQFTDNREGLIKFLESEVNENEQI